MIWLDRVLRRRRLYDDLHDEIHAHLEEKVDELVARGLSRRAAELEARRAFGNVTSLQEEGRATWQWPTLESFLMDVRFAFRQLRRTPMHSAIIVLTLAVGIGAATSVFSWASAILLDPLPGTKEADRILALEMTTPSGSWTPTSWLDYRDFRTNLRSFDGLAAAYPTAIAVGDDRQAERRWGELVSANFFDVLGVRPTLGRFFPPALEAPGAEPTVVISHDLWQSRWQGDSGVIGRVVHINRFPFTVIGVAPSSFHGSLPGVRVQLWVPAAMLGQIVPTGGWWLRDRASRTFRVLGRLAPGVSTNVARTEVAALGSVMARLNADVSSGMGATVLPLMQSHYGIHDALRAPLFVLLAACGLVLLIVCANTANLLVARSTGRRRELAVRLALGAPRRRLARQLLTEASVLAVSGAAFGLLSAVWLARSLRWLLPTFAMSSLVEPRVNASVLLFAGVLAASVTLAAGLAPAIQGSRESLNDALHEGGRGGIGGLRSARARGLLVAAEMALAVIAVVGAGLFYQSFRHTRAVSPGFDSERVAISTISTALAGYDSARGDALLAAVASRLRSRAGVMSVSYTDYVPLSLGAGSWEDLRVEGYTPQTGESMKLYRAAIGPDYFRTMRTPLVEGREFTIADDSAGPRVMIVNESFVRQYLAGRAPLGHRVRGWGKWFTIVGVVRDSKTYRLTEPARPYFYVPVRQVYRPEYGYSFVVRAGVSADEAVRAIGATIRAIDPTIPVFNAMPLSEYIDGPLAGQRTVAAVLGVMAVVSLLLSAIGLYGVIAYAVSQRTKEIGVRVALGAQRGDVLRAVGGNAARLLIRGLVAGLAGAVAVARVAASQLFGVNAGDVTVFATAAAVMTAVAIAAIYVPARRALAVSPIRALRVE